jgi:ComF family protein
MPSLSSFAWPTQCAVCRSWGRARLCGDCSARHAAPRPRCIGCAQVVPLGVERCGACLLHPLPFAHTIAAVDYAYPWNGLVTGLKFHALSALALPMAELLAARVRAAGRERVASLLVPVPLGRERLVERGMNQAWELARRVARRLQRDAEPFVLRRRVETPHLADLPRAERERAIRGAFELSPGASARVAGAHVAIVDDVMTTGATSAEAAQVLLDAGAAAVDLWVFARTP